MGDFLVGLAGLQATKEDGVWHGTLNVGSSAFHEGRGAGKTDPRGS
jgi:hypothetical protein